MSVQIKQYCIYEKSHLKVITTDGSHKKTSLAVVFLVRGLKVYFQLYHQASSNHCTVHCEMCAPVLWTPYVWSMVVFTSLRHFA